MTDKGAIRTPVLVLTVDQRGSSGSPDAVPELLATLRRVAPAPLLAFERTAGDEVQGVLADPEATVDVITAMLTEDRWSIGVGVDLVESPLPSSTRAARGAAFVAAREAVNRAKSGPHHLSVVGADGYRAEQVETVLWLLSAILRRRTARGWEVQRVLATGVSHAEAGRRLGISQPAVSQRAQAAGLLEEKRARKLAGQLLAAMVGGER
ncbi:MAG: transposase [Nocardioidaceae bacterium]